MSDTIASLIPAAIGIAISPVPIVELILVIFSRRRLPNTVAFVVTLIVLNAAALAMGAAGEKASESSSHPRARAWRLRSSSSACSCCSSG